MGPQPRAVTDVLREYIRLSRGNPVSMGQVFSSTVQMATMPSSSTHLLLYLRKQESVWEQAPNHLLPGQVGLWL